jgi:hypothetical protein
MGEAYAFLSLSECLGLEISVFAVYYHVVEHDDQGIDMEMRMGVNESRDESEEGEEAGYGNEEAEAVSTFEDIGYALEELDLEYDITGDLEGMDFCSGKYFDVLRMLILEGDDGDAGRVHEWKCGEMMGYVGSGSFDIDKSGQLGFEVLLLEYLLVLVGAVMDVDTYT